MSGCASKAPIRLTEIADRDEVTAYKTCSAWFHHSQHQFQEPRPSDGSEAGLILASHEHADKLFFPREVAFEHFLGKTGTYKV